MNIYEISLWYRVVPNYSVSSIKFSEIVLILVSNFLYVLFCFVYPSWQKIYTMWQQSGVLLHYISTNYIEYDEEWTYIN